MKGATPYTYSPQFEMDEKFSIISLASFSTTRQRCLEIYRMQNYEKKKEKEKKKASSSKFQAVWTTYEEKQKEKFRQSH